MSTFGNDEKMLAYVGREAALSAPAGPLYRCVPVPERQLPARFAAERRAEFASLPEGVLYIGAGIEPDDFTSEIAPRLPKRPHALFIRDNGAGDVIMSTPAVREFRRMYPKANITYATLPAHFELLEGNANIDSVVSAHDPALFRRGYDLIVNWARAVENYSVKRNRGPRIDSFARMMGLALSDRRPDYAPSEADRKFARGFLAGRGEKFIGYVLQAAAWNRTWPLWRAPELVAELRKRLPERRVVLIDRQEESGFEADGAVNACGATGRFGEAAALLECCELAITQDTGLAHACGALGVRTLVVAGSVPPAARYSAYENFHWIHPAGRVDCCPCWDWQETRRGGPRGDTGRNICLESIAPTEIADRATRIILLGAINTCHSVIPG
jgi:heptosyltransferase-2